VGSTNIPWAAIVEQLRLSPDRWLALPEMAAVPERTVDVIRGRQRAALRLEHGTVRCRIQASIENEGRVTCTLILKYEPKEASRGSRP
jgi:hypothetical protein